MIAETGKFFFRMTIAVSIISSILIPAVSGLGYPVPDPLIRASGILGLITGRNTLASLLSLTGEAAFALSGMFLLGALTKLIGLGSMQLSQAISLKVVAVYLALWTPAADGASIVFAIIREFAGAIFPGGVAATAYALLASAEAFVKFTILYYLFVRAFGLPNE